HATQKLIEEQSEVHGTKVRAAMDQQLLRRAVLLANKARTISLHYELFAPITALGCHLSPVGQLPVVEYVSRPDIFFRKQLREEIHIPDADELVPGLEMGTDYFQAYRWKGSTSQRSESLRDHSFTLDSAFRERAKLSEDRFDDVELEPGVRLRRVTLKA